MLLNNSQLGLELSFLEETIAGLLQLLQARSITVIVVSRLKLPRMLVFVCYQPYPP